MTMIIAVTLFALGAIFASFIGVLVARLNTGQSFFFGRSRCDACSVPLSALSLLPILSFLLSKGHARCCGVRVSRMAPSTELLLGALFVLAYFSLGFSSVLPFVLFSFALLLALVLYDFAHQILPSSILGAFITTSAVASFLAAPSITAFSENFITALLIATSLAALHFFSRGRAMGFSDAPLSFGLALLVGPAAFPGFIFSFWIGAVIGIVLLARRPRGSRMGVEVPFAPFLAAGFLLAYFTQWNPFIFIAASL